MVTVYFFCFCLFACLFVRWLVFVLFCFVLFFVLGVELLHDIYYYITTTTSVFILPMYPKNPPLKCKKQNNKTTPR